MSKRIFLAGAAGAIGRRLCPLLIANGWSVAGTTRSQAKVPLLRELGVEPVVLDVYDANALRSAMAAARPDVVIHQLTDLPPGLDPARLPSALVANARLREVGTRNLVSAAVECGAARLVAQSIALLYADGPLPHTEDHPLLPETHPEWGDTVRGVLSLESQVLGAPLQGIVLRYGLLYGPGTGIDAPAAPFSVHIDAAANAAELAATRGLPGIYNITEPGGLVDSSKAIESLGWQPDFRAPG